MAVVNRAAMVNDLEAGAVALRQIVDTVGDLEGTQRVRIGLHWFLQETATGNCVLIYGPTGVVKQTWTP